MQVACTKTLSRGGLYELWLSIPHPPPQLALNLVPHIELHYGAVGRSGQPWCETLARWQSFLSMMESNLNGLLLYVVVLNTYPYYDQRPGALQPML
jgi:hypothetical protein